jgi:hypothetical protein
MPLLLLLIFLCRFREATSRREYLRPGRGRDAKRGGFERFAIPLSLTRSLSQSRSVSCPRCSGVNNLKRE